MNPSRIGNRRYLAAAIAAITMALLGWPTASSSAVSMRPAASNGPIIVTLGFDDGTLDQFTNGLPILQAHGMHATFFVNSGPIDAGDPAHMTWADLQTMYTAGDEMADTPSITRTSSHYRSLTPSTRCATTATG